MTVFMLSICMWIANINALQPQEPVQWLQEMEFDFGDIKPGVPVQHAFTFKNVSQEPITIETVRTSCGCTGSTWTETPVSPDSTGLIKVEFDAKQTGEFRKYAKVYFVNWKGAHKLWISGLVVEQ